MNFDEQQRTPDIILEYFELLKWNKNGRKIEIPAETLESSEQLQSIKQELNRIQALTVEKEILISSNQKEADRIKPVISSVEQSLLSLREEIILARRERLQYVETTPQLEVFSQFKKPGVSATPPPGLSGAFRRLFLSIGNDFRAIYLDIKQAISILDLLVLLQYFLVVLIVVTILLSFTYLINFAFYVSLGVYMVWKLVYTLGRREKVQSHQYENTEISQQHQARQHQQKLELNLYELEQQYAKYEQHLNQQKLKEQELTSRVRAAHSDLVDLKCRRGQQTENCQKIREEIIEQDRRFNVERLLYLESLTQKWLDEDIDCLTEGAKRELNLIDGESIDVVGAIQDIPIRVLIGFTERTSPSLLVEDSGGNPKSNEALALNISPEEYKSEPTYDGKKRRYGVYEFLVIFLCSNFLSYYKCYFNFIRNQPVDEEYCEYLYDSIVSTKIQEKSSINMKNNDDQKQVYNNNTPDKI